MSDIVERLRNDRYASWLAIVPMCMEAADEIERLRAECEELRDIVNRYADHYIDCPAYTPLSSAGCTCGLDAALASSAPTKEKP